MTKFLFHMVRLTLILSILFMMHSSYASSQNLKNTKISLNENNATLVDIFNQIANITNFNFTYSGYITENEERFDAVYQKQSLEYVLTDLGRRVGFSYLVNGKDIMVAAKKVKPGFSDSSLQQSLIKGKVTDTEGLPLFGANVIEKGNSNGVITGMDGDFSIAVTNKDAVLVVSYIGFISKEITVGEQTNFEIVLQEDTQQLEAVVITALGRVEKKKKLSYATRSISTEQINYSRNGDLASQLSSRVAGLRLNQTSTGGLVSSSRIVLRGENSLNFNNNQPLIIVDGVPVSSNLDGVGSSNVQDDIPTDYGNGFTGINPDDIASVNILKGPTAAALYGSRAANGAIVLTTKSGEGRPFSIVVNSGVTFESITRSWDFQNEYGAGLGGNYINGLGLSYGPRLDGNTSESIMGSPNMPNAEPLLPYAENTFVDDFYRTGVTSNHNISISAANDVSHIRTSYTHQHKEGIIPNTDFTKQAFSVKGGYKVTEQIKSEVVFNYIKTDSDNLPVIGYGGQSLGYSALFWPRNASVDWVRDYWVEGQEFVTQNHVTFFTADNPWLIVNENINAFDKNRVYGNYKLSYKINDKLSVFARAGTDFYNDDRVSRRPIGAAQFRNGMYREQKIGFQESNFDFLATYYNAPADSALSYDASIGGNVMYQTGNSFLLDSRALTVPGIYNAGNIADIPSLEEQRFERQINSIYGTFQLGIKDAIFFTITGRNDWSSTLPEENNSYFYPSFGTSIIVSDLVNLPNFISFAKVRSTYAEVGADTNPFLINQAFNYGTLPGSVENQSLIANNNLKPERTSSFELGAEVGFFDNRVTTEVNYYNTVSNNQILQAPVSAATGFGQKLINAGEIKNSGVEVLIKATPFQGGAFRWDMILNYARNRSEIVKLADGIESFVILEGGVSSGSYTIEARPGGEYGDIYGPVFERSPGGEIVFNNGLPVLAQNVGKVGNINPDWTSGLTNTFSYKRFNLAVQMEYRSGGTVYSGSNAVMYVTGVSPESAVNREGQITGDGVIANGDGTYRPNDVAVDAQTFYFDGFYGRNNAETNVFDATFFKIREIALGVDLTDAFSSVAAVKGAHLSLFGRNLGVWAKSNELRHFDPEIVTHNGGNTLVPGIETAQLPGTATYGFNLKLEL